MRNAKDALTSSVRMLATIATIVVTNRRVRRDRCRGRSNYVLKKT